MMKRIVAIITVIVLALGCVFALAETAAVEPTAEVVAAEITEEAAAEATTEEAAAEETAETEPAPVPEGKTRYVSAPSGVYMREAADVKAKVVATPDFNYMVKEIGREGKWSHVIFETSHDRVFEGYIWTAYLSDKKTVLKKAEAPAPAPAVTEEPDPAVTEESTYVPIPA